MEITKPMTLESDQPLSKAISELMESGTAVIITKNSKYYGIIDDRNLRQGISDAHNTKCETVVVKPPTLNPKASVLEQINSFLNGHFKALPVVDENGMSLGITTRVEVLKEMVDQKLIPKVRVSEVMSSPVYSIEETETIAKAKNTMKDLGTRRLVVTKKGTPTGVISTLDLASYMLAPRAMEKKPSAMKEVDSINDKFISEFLRHDLTTISEESTIEGAAKRMIEKKVSHVIVISDKDKKPVGVLSALDVFKKIQGLAKDEVSMSISGLGEESIWQFPEIKSKIGGVLNKFTKSFNIRNVSVHVKEMKSTYEVFIYLDTDHGHISLSSEGKALKESVDEVSSELETVLSKKKDMRISKARRVHSGQENEVY